MPNSNPRDRFFDQYLTLMKDSYDTISFFIQIKKLDYLFFLISVFEQTGLVVSHMIGNH